MMFVVRSTRNCVILRGHVILRLTLQQAIELDRALERRSIVLTKGFDLATLPGVVLVSPKSQLILAKELLVASTGQVGDQQRRGFAISSRPGEISIQLDAWMSITTAQAVDLATALGRGNEDTAQVNIQSWRPRLARAITGLHGDLNNEIRAAGG